MRFFNRLKQIGQYFTGRKEEDRTELQERFGRINGY